MRDEGVKSIPVGANDRSPHRDQLVNSFPGSAWECNLEAPPPLLHEAEPRCEHLQVKPGDEESPLTRS